MDIRYDVKIRVKRRDRRLLPVLLLLFSFIVFLLGCTNKKGKTSDMERLCRTGIFSWEGMYLEPEQEERIQYAMEKLGCWAIYQGIPSKADEDMVLDYLKRRHKAGQDVYYLAGAPEWGLETDASSMVSKVRTVGRWNRKAGESGFTGIVWDVEPYLLDEWDESREEMMELFVKNCEASYREAEKNGLAVILCIPYFYDSSGVGGYLEQLVDTGCDAIAIMNYNKRDEKGQIAFEYQLAQKYGKGIINVTELQEPGYHELTEKNTYFYDGIDAVADSWETLKGEYSDPAIGFAWHYLDPILGILERGNGG